MARKINIEKPVHRNPIHSTNEKKQNRAVIIGFIVTAVLIASFIGYALIYETVLKNRIPVAKVNGVVIDNEYYQDRVRLERNSYVQQFNLIYAQYQLPSEDPSSSEYYQSQLAQVQQILDNSESFSKLVLDKVVDEELIIQQAEERGLSVSDQEVEETIQGLFRFYPNGTPTPEPTAATFSTPTPSQAQLELLKYTPTPFSLDANLTDDVAEAQLEPTESDAETDTVEIQETPEAEAAGAEPTATTVPPTPTIAATPTLYSEAKFQEEYQSYVNDLAAINVKESNLRKYMHNFMLIQKVRDEIVNDIPHEQEQVWARHILVKTKTEAIIVLDRLDQGEDWSLLAADVSLDTSNKDNGGDLGWFPRGRMVAPFESAAFDLTSGEISEPVESQFGWHIIQLIGKETLPLSNSEYESIQEVEYQKWFQKIREGADIKINDVWKDLAPKEPSIPQEFRVF